ncbi:Geranylgeranyl pyrophosphate synthase family protein [Rhynchospora pubera]|uniref:Geranylgeranyl pyrophosphate synthase family protein n=1 Tax=Rhynchospora pubera TaxID=906938 RepID=A0AAV8GAP3_9POAL|nr:Geranylgeranyl pyrophosphate synthase family protein [Rhynchospora pubera]KAJ4800153.1 Geranylgeranyl pyrophosphate synthase family protein [Rhynchospora pubera]
MALSVASLISTPVIPKTSKSRHFAFNSHKHHPTSVSLRPCSASLATIRASTSFDLRSYRTSLISVIESELDAALTVHYPENMYEAMRYSVFRSGAKRAPSIMCIAACELFGALRAAALPTAAALEMIHAASHMHDDLPCMDAAPVRRGQPSTHAQYGVGVALLSGDALFPLGLGHTATKTPSDLVPREALVLVLKEISRTVGCTGMAAGQLLDLSGAAAKGELEVLHVLEKKFGELAECSAVCGGILAGAKADDQAKLRQYGRTVGVLYELVDDVLTESNGSAGKMRSNASVVRTLGMERALELVEQFKAKAKNELQIFGDRYGDRVLPLYSFVDYAVERGFMVEGREEAGGVTPAASAASR